MEEPPVTNAGIQGASNVFSEIILNIDISRTVYPGIFGELENSVTVMTSDTTNVVR